MPHITLDAKDLNPSQVRLLNCAAPQVLFSGGFGSGKTTGLILKTLQLISMNPGTPGLIVAANWRQMWGVVYRSLRDILSRALPRHELPRLVDRQQECYLDFGDGTPIFLRSAKNPDGFDGTNAGWMVGDELRYWSRHAYEVAIGRVRTKCPIPQKAFASTPQMNWMSQIFCHPDDDRVLITAPTKENEHNLAPGFIDDLRKSYSPRVQKALLEGIFTVLEGAVYEQFDPSRQSPWMVEFNPTRKILQNKRVFLAIDPGYRRSAAIWFAKTGELEWTVFDELMLDNCSDESLVQQINAKDWPVDEIWVDPAADNTQSVQAMDSLSVLAMIKTRTRDPMRSVSVYRDIRFGVDKTRVLLGGYNGLPIRIKFARRLLEIERDLERGIIRDISALRYPEAKDGRPVSDLPLKDGVTDHSCDAFRYFCVSRWLSEPKLRSRDKLLRDDVRPGWTLHNLYSN